MGAGAPDEVVEKRGRFSIYLLAFLPWGVLAPLNFVKLLLNTVSPYAHVWVPKETEQCQAACGIARMWATLFWGLQFISALSFVYVHYHRDQTGLVYAGIASKLVVGTLLLKAYFAGVVFWPIGLAGAVVDWALAVGFALELRARATSLGASASPWALGGRLSFMEDELSQRQLKAARVSLRKGEVPREVSRRLSGGEADLPRLETKNSFKEGFDYFMALGKGEEPQKKAR